jgi:CRISPR-associated protein Csh1
MLDTLLKIGQQLGASADREEFDDIIAVPPIDEKQKEKNFTFHIAEIIFDLDRQEVRLGALRDFSELDKKYIYSPFRLRCIKIQGGNNKNIYPTVDPRKSYEPLKKTFFSKKDKDGNAPKEADITEAIRKEAPDLMDSELYKVIEQIFPLGALLEGSFPDLDSISKSIGLGANQKIVMLFTSVLAVESFSIKEAKPIASLQGYDDFIRRKFLVKGVSEKSTSDTLPKICYVTGELQDDVFEPAFNSRYSINKMFVTTTKNYATGFIDKEFGKNYQLSRRVESSLERGSAHLLKNYVVKIAGLSHCVVPQFLARTTIDLDHLTFKITKRSDLLFQMTEKRNWERFESDLEFTDEEGMYWINFLGFDSDGNFFKTINHIKNIGKTHFVETIDALKHVEREMTDVEGISWESVMTYGKERTRCNFNFHTIFNLIPVRKEKRNDALILFKAILEQREIERNHLFGFFTELILCHRFSRYSAYQITPNGNFDFATRNAVFQYQAFIQFLRKLNLLKMEEKSPPVSAATLPEIERSIIAFFERMSYSDAQKAMFYLGRVLNSVAYAQHKKNHTSKPILNKLNYNGMDKRAIIRLRIDLMEKCKQYDVLNYNELLFSKFNDLFNPSEFILSSEEALFFLLSGYSFRTPKEANEEPLDAAND